MESARSFVPGQVGTSVQHDGVVKFGGSPTKRANTDRRLKAGEERPFVPVNTPVDAAYPKTTHHDYAPPKASMATTTTYPAIGVQQHKYISLGTTDYPGAESTNVAGAHHDPVGADFAGTHNRGPTAAGTRHDPLIDTSHAPSIRTDGAGTHDHAPTTTGTHFASNIATSAGSHHAPNTSGTPITTASQGTTHPAAGTHHDPMIATSHAPSIGTSTGMQHTPPIMTTGTQHAPPTVDISTSAGTHHAPPTVDISTSAGTPTIPASVRTHHVPASARTHREPMEQGSATSKLGGVLENRLILEEDLHGPGAYNKNYQSKATDPTGRGAEEIGGVTPAVMQSLDNMRTHDYSRGSHDQFSPEPITSETSSILQKQESEQPEFLDTEITNKGDQRREVKITSEKAAHAKDLIASRLGYGSSPDDVTPQQGDQSYTQKLSSVAGTVADKATEAKNVVASKLGYGHPSEPERHTGGAIAREGEDTTQAGSLGSEGRTNFEDNDKGVSVKEYFVEKLTPGEEDKSLSEVISKSLHKETQGQGKEKEDVKGRVTETEEVRTRLSHSSEEKLGDEGVGSGGGDSPGRTMVDQFKGAMTDWFGKGGETQPSKGFHDVSKG